MSASRLPAAACPRALSDSTSLRSHPVRIADASEAGKGLSSPHADVYTPERQARLQALQRRGCRFVV